jgi:RNA polymerase sigma-70 factor (ECF subfamily)
MDQAVQARELSDPELCRRFTAGGDRAAFSELVMRHIGMLRRLLFVLFNGNYDDCRDAEQEILVSLFLDLKNFRFQSSFKTFFYRYGRNKGIDILRKQSRERKKAEDYARNEQILRSVPDADAADPVRLLMRREEKQQLLRALFSLPAGDRELLFMKEGEGLSVAEIAGVLGVPEGTVKARLHRARRKAARRLEEEYG